MPCGEGLSYGWDSDPLGDLFCDSQMRVMEMALLRPNHFRFLLLDEPTASPQPVTTASGTLTLRSRMARASSQPLISRHAQISETASKGSSQRVPELRSL